jgi:phosphomannomutase
MAGAARWLQSYSGVRAVLGDGPDISVEDEAFAFRHAYCYALSRLQANPAAKVRIVLARDPRPTGPALRRHSRAGSACRDPWRHAELINLGVVSTPVWQHSVRMFQAHGGVMITASHNPLDNNGWKYATGVETLGGDPAPPGALLSASDMASLIRAANAFRPASTRIAIQAEPDSGARERAISDMCALWRTYHANVQAPALSFDTNGGAASHRRPCFQALGVDPIVVNDTRCDAH